MCGVRPPPPRFGKPCGDEEIVDIHASAPVDAVDGGRLPRRFAHGHVVAPAVAAGEREHDMKRAQAGAGERRQPGPVRHRTEPRKLLLPQFGDDEEPKRDPDRRVKRRVHIVSG